MEKWTTSDIIYAQTLDYLYSRLPVYQRIGAAAYKIGLGNSIDICNRLGNPQQQFKTIHVAGTNGKGSSSHLLAAILQSAGYKTGLYTSPHLKNFTERIKIDGNEIPQNYVVDFTERAKKWIDDINPSFFELTVGLAFEYFAAQKVDIAVIEVGLGGRLDSTNIINPQICLITNISYDHQALLGDTLPQIAYEKAGIIKANVPVVVSQKQPETEAVFRQIAAEKNAPLFFAEDFYALQFDNENIYFDIINNHKTELKQLICQLKGHYQPHNIVGVLKTIDLLKDTVRLDDNHLRRGLAEVCTLTNFKGRWQQLNEKPLTICDTAHNEAGISEIVKQINSLTFKQLHFVFGTVNDKDISKILKLLPQKAVYYFCKPNIPRGLEANILQQQAAAVGLQGDVYESVAAAIEAAKAKAENNDLVFIGGSNFVVAEIENL